MHTRMQKKKIAPGHYVVLAHNPTGFTVHVGGGEHYAITHRVSYSKHGKKARDVARGIFSEVVQRETSVADKRRLEGAPKKKGVPIVLTGKRGGKFVVSRKSGKKMYLGGKAGR